MNPPKEVFIDFTNNCNYKCIFCTNSNLTERKVLSPTIFKDLEDLINKAELVDITGWGEITTHPNFFEIIKILSDSKKPYTFTTNGYHLTEEAIEIIKNSSVKSINISVNSLTPSIHSKICGVSEKVCEKVISNVINLASCKKYFLSCSFVMNKYNFHEMPEIIKFAAKHKIHIVLFDLMPACESHYEEGLRIPDTPENRRKLAAMEIWADKMGVSYFCFKFDNRNIKESGKVNNLITGCQWPHEKIFIRWDGVVTPCCWCLKEMGNVLSEGWEHVWNNENYKELRECLKNNDPKYCKNCRRLG